ncbi:MAG: Hpt domain-containing protein [Bdellovibrionaceae bacterium]|nr:Hpt domain-containing protein [Pseudobdellovibrionaceae bacterium]
MQIESEKPQEGLEEYVPEFLDSRDQDILLLKAALAQGDFETLRRKAHDWKGFSRPFGFLKLEGIAKKLEEAAKSTASTECSQLLEEAEVYLQKKRELISNV